MALRIMTTILPKTDFYYMAEEHLLSAMERREQLIANVKAGTDISFFVNGRGPSTKTNDGVAIVNVSGTLSRGVAPIDNAFGDSGYEQIETELAQAVDDPEVHAILMRIDSPGGAVVGCAECAAAVKAAAEAKPVIAFTDTMACSAAYWLATSATTFYAAPSALVGSVGVISMMVDRTEMLAKMGIKVRAFTPEYATLKGMGSSYTPMSSEQEDYYQEFINELGAKFKNAVLENMGSTIPAHALRGQAMTAEAAKPLGMVNETTTFNTAYGDALIQSYTNYLFNKIK